MTSPSHTGAALRLVAPADTPADPTGAALAAWYRAVPRELLAARGLTGDSRLVGAYMWALAGEREDTLLRTSAEAIAAALTMPATTVRDALARLARAGYLTIVASRAERPDRGGGVELRVLGPAALARTLREHRPADTPQRELPLATAGDLVTACSDTAADITARLSASRPHTCHQCFVVAGALLAHGVALAVLRRDGHLHGPVSLARDNVLSAVAAAERREEPGRDYYYLLRERLSAAAGCDVRMPSPAAIRAACERIGWAWRATWAQSPRDLLAAWRAARAAGDDRPYSAWCAARDDDP